MRWVIVFGCMVLSVASAQILAPTRVTTYDWQCQDASGNRISDHQRSDLALIACINASNGAQVQGGRYRINRQATPVNCTVSPWSAWSGGAWSVCVNGSQTRQETRTRTVVTQPANGGLACPALTETRTASQACSATTGAATLSWTPPTRRTNGTALTNLAGYRIAYGTTQAALSQAIQVANPAATSYVVSNLSPATYYFSVRAYDTTGAESDPSSIASKVVQ